MAEEVGEILKQRDFFMRSLARIAKEGCMENHFINDSTATVPAEPRRVSCLDVLGKLMKKPGQTYTVEVPCIACRARQALMKYDKQDIEVTLGND